MIGLFSDTSHVTTALLALVYVSAVATALWALFEVRTPQGTAAWIVFLLSFPFIALPAFWIFGRKKFVGYKSPRLRVDTATKQISSEIQTRLAEAGVTVDPLKNAFSQAMARVVRMPFANRNRVELLIDGEATYRALEEAIEGARHYLLVQYYIFRADATGERFKNLLVKKAREGVRCHFLVDQIGTRLPAAFLEEMSTAGIRIETFNTTSGRRRRFQINFRNHRKTVVVDGRTAFVGGLNIGDEYLGKFKHLSPWRDTHVKVQGPAALRLQLFFQEDWFWARHQRLDLDWTLEHGEDADMTVLAVPSGPADPFETGTLLHLSAVQEARERLWIATPYFVPDEPFVSALQLAALRGVDVRVIVPRKNDGFWNKMATIATMRDLQRAGVRFYWFERGFMHQKVLLVDRNIAFVGTANFDCRSFRLNFEMTVVVVDAGFASQVEAMLLHDLEGCRPASDRELARRPFWYRAAAQVIRLLAPIL